MSDPKSASFRRYVSTRRYHQGRGSRAGWAFIAHAFGDPDLPNPSSWRELRAYLTQGGAEQALIEAANIVWRSYLSHISRERRGGTANAFGQERMIVSKPSLVPTASRRVQSCTSATE